MGGLLSQQVSQQAPPGPAALGLAPGGVPGLGVLPEGGMPDLGVIQGPALEAGATSAQKPQDELSERYRAQQVSGVFGGGDILSQLLAAITGQAAPGAANVPGSIIGPGAGGIQLGAGAPGGINIDPVVAAIIEAYQQMIGGSAGAPAAGGGLSVESAARGTPGGGMAGQLGLGKPERPGSDGPQTSETGEVFKP